MMTLTAERLRELLEYDPETGEFRWLRHRARGARAGSPAGYINAVGYRVIMLSQRAYHAHRLAWLYMAGEWPRGDLDHINGDRADNRRSNLRLADRTQNNANARRRSDNTSGHKGVSRHGQCNRWQARIRVRGRTIYLGLHKTQEAAAAAYDAAAREHFGEYARLS
jgi:hypothetical protein